MNQDFKKVTSSAKKMFGPEKIMLAGLDPEQQRIIDRALTDSNFKNYPWIFIPNSRLSSSLNQLLDLEFRFGLGESSEMARAVILSGFTENDLHQFMAFFKNLNLPSSLWAVVTPTSIGWLCRDLLEALQAEHQGLKNRHQG